MPSEHNPSDKTDIVNSPVYRICRSQDMDLAQMQAEKTDLKRLIAIFERCVKVLSAQFSVV